MIHNFIIASIWSHLCFTDATCIECCRVGIEFVFPLAECFILIEFSSSWGSCRTHTRRTRLPWFWSTDLEKIISSISLCVSFSAYELMYNYVHIFITLAIPFLVFSHISHKPSSSNLNGNMNHKIYHWSIKECINRIHRELMTFQLNLIFALFIQRNYELFERFYRRFEGIEINSWTIFLLIDGTSNWSARISLHHKANQ